MIPITRSLPIILLVLLFHLSRGYELPFFPSVASVHYDGRLVPSGQRVSQAATARPPTVALASASSAHLYTLVMIDPDAPSSSSPAMAQWLHYLHCDIPGHILSASVALAPSSSSASESSSPPRSTVMANYAPPTPPAGTGYHRYVLYVFRQSGRMGATASSSRAITESNSMKRARWDVDKWKHESEEAAGVELTLEAGMYFMVSADATDEDGEDINELSIRNEM